VPDFINMESNSPGHVDITLDLAPYINAYEKAHNPNVRAPHRQAIAAAAFDELKTDIYDQLDGISGQMHWLDALTLATQTLDKTLQAAIEASPAVDMMENSFIEIIKNSMDEAVSSHYESNQEPIIKLSLEIDHASHPDLISIQITDSGHGFPETFLEKVNTPEARDTYVNTSRGSNREKHSDRPPLFGGQGRGLRILIADEDGDVLEHSERIHRFTKPDVSTVELSNAEDGDGHIKGAQITLTTSIQPREELGQKFSSMKEKLHAKIAESRIESQATTQPPSPLTIDVGEDEVQEVQKDLPLTVEVSPLSIDVGEEDDFEDDDFPSPKW